MKFPNIQWCKKRKWDFNLLVLIITKNTLKKTRKKNMRVLVKIGI